MRRRLFPTRRNGTRRNGTCRNGACRPRGEDQCRARRVSSFLVPAMVIIGTWSAAGPSRCQGQGLLQRLEDRIRSRIEQRLPPRGPARPPIGREIRRGNGTRAPIPRVRSARPSNAAPVPERGARSAGRASLGIEASEHRGTVTGLEVVQFAPRSLADEAGLRLGDVIMAIDGVATPTARTAGRQLRQHRAGESVRLRVFRGGAVRNLSVPLVPDSPAGEDVTGDQPATVPNAQARTPRSARSAPSARPGSSGTAPRRPDSPLELRSPAAPSSAATENAENDGWTERRAEPRARRDDARASASEDDNGSAFAADARLGAEWRDVEGEHGVQVESVAERSPAGVAGLRPGDRIVSLDGRVITDAQTLTREIARHSPGDRLVVQWVRDSGLVEADVTLAGPDGVSPLAEQSAEADAEAGTGADSEATAESGTRSMLENVGSALGGFFSGGQSPASNSAAEPGQTDSEDEAEANAENAAPASEPPGAAEETAGDEEPTGEDSPRDGQAENAAAEPLPAPLPAPAGSAEQSSTVQPASGELEEPDSGELEQLGDRDPPSLKRIMPPERSLPTPANDREAGPAVVEAAGSDAPPPPPRWRETVERLRAEIERLEERIRRLEDDR